MLNFLLQSCVALNQPRVETFGLRLQPTRFLQHLLQGIVGHLHVLTELVQERTLVLHICLPQGLELSRIRLQRSA